MKTARSLHSIQTILHSHPLVRTFSTSFTPRQQRRFRPVVAQSDQLIMRTRTLTRQDKRAKRSLHNSEGNPHNSPQTITPSSPHPASGSPQAPSTSTFHQTLQDPAYTSPNQDTTPEPPPKAPDGEQDEEELDEEEDARLEKSFGFRPAPQFEPTNVPKLKDTRNLATRFGSVVREGEEWKC